MQYSRKAAFPKIAISKNRATRKRNIPPKRGGAGGYQRKTVKTRPERPGACRTLVSAGPTGHSENENHSENGRLYQNPEITKKPGNHSGNSQRKTLSKKS